MLKEHNQTMSNMDSKDLVLLYKDLCDILRYRGLLIPTRHRYFDIQKQNQGNINLQEKLSFVSGQSNYPKFILNKMMGQDWKKLFKGNYDQSKDYYVYYHCDPIAGSFNWLYGNKKNKKHLSFKGKPFYIGKGKGGRFKSKSRSSSHRSIINDLINLGVEESCIFHIFENNLNELEALELEAKLINFFGCSSEINPKHQHFHGENKGGWLCNSDFARRPKWIDDLVIRKGVIKPQRKLTDKELRQRGPVKFLNHNKTAK
tara:strand:+ start:4734 stop:5510 length:777 start_codon:yes stop_codon:yes gene_type:complete